MSLWIFYPFLIRLYICIFLLLSFMSYLYILDISPYQVHDLQLFSPIQAREEVVFFYPWVWTTCLETRFWKTKGFQSLTMEIFLKLLDWDGKWIWLVGDFRDRGWVFWLGQWLDLLLDPLFVMSRHLPYRVPLGVTSAYEIRMGTKKGLESLRAIWQFLI